jgi:tetratricopeptide (TPR) repeat protein
MTQLSSSSPALVAVVLFFASLAAASAEIPVQVLTLDGQPVADLILIQREGVSPAPPTDAQGQTRLLVAAGADPATWIELGIRQPRAKVDPWFILRPWPRLLPISRAQDPDQAPIQIGIARVSSAALLDTAVGLEGITANVLARFDRNGPAQGGMTSAERSRLLAEEAARFGVAPAAMDTAIRNWDPGSTKRFCRGLVALYTERYAEATELLEEVWNQAEMAGQRDPAQAADAAFFLAYGLSQQGLFDHAADALRRAESVRPDDPSILLALGRALHRAGDFNAAEEVLRQVLAAHEAELGADHLDVAYDLNNLAAVLVSLGDLAEAEPLLVRVLEIRATALGSEHPEVAAALSNLGVVNLESGRIVEARNLYERALEIDEKALGPTDPMVAADLNKLALVLDLQGRNREAEELFRRALAILDSTLEPSHPDLAHSLANLAYFLHHSGRWQEAEPLYRRSVEILEARTDTDPLLLATTLRHLAMLYQKQERLGEAEPLYRQALTLFEQVDPNDPEIVPLLWSLSDLLECTDRVAEAAELEARAKAIRSRTD